MDRHAAQQEQRLTFLVGLEHALRPLTDPLTIQETASRVICRELGTDSAGYSVMAGGEEPGQVRTQAGHGLGALLRDFNGSGMRFGWALAESLGTGRTLAVSDVLESPLFTPENRAALSQFGIRAFVAVPLVRDGRCVAVFGASHSSARRWRPLEVTLVEDTAAHTWTAVEQARVQAALRETEDRARRSEDRYRLLYDTLRDAFVQVDMSGRIVDCNDAYVELVGYTREELLELTYVELTPARWHAMEEGIVENEILARGYSRVYEKEYRRKDGAVVPVELRSILLRDEDGTPFAMWAIVRDISERRRAEEALRERETVLRFLTDEVRALHEAAVLDPGLSEDALAPVIVAQGGQLLASPSSALYLLRPGGSLDLAAAEGSHEAAEADDAAAEAIGERSTVLRLRDEADTGQAGLGLLVVVPLLIRDSVYGALAFAFRREHEIEDPRLRVARGFADQAALALENARLRARLEEKAVEEERNRLARDLHDSVTQSLFAASLKAESLAEAPGVAADVQDGLRELHRLTRGAMAGMRTMLLEMRAGALAQTPLPGLLRHLVEAAQSRTGAPISLAVQGEAALPEDVRVAAYRITQEALNNAVRHAAASRVAVDLSLGEDGLRLRVEDDGRGFDESVSAGHFGLATMRERAQGVGAALDVASAPGLGTVVSMDWRRGRGGRRAA